KLLEQSYSRLVATNFGELKKYKGGTDYVYGEILPGLVDEITSIARLTSNSVFVDLGSGVGQIVGQVSLMVGCFSYGIELDKSRAAIGKAMVENIRVRCNKWGAEIGVMEIEVGNMLNSPRVVEILGQADAVFIGNTKFD
ncbi:histone methylation DOT1, partial [Armillaria luteobubalina]